jgi:phosphoglycolate phosphatase-like HAD superfamily hydrolase
MKLAVFDLDGTLTRTFQVDGACYVQAFADSLGIHAVNSEWSTYEHVTDSGVMSEIFATTFGRCPDAAEVSSFIECFVGLLNECYRINPERFGEIPGAASLVTRLGEGSEWGVAIATGSWERSARFKIKVAGIPADGVPAAFAEDGPSREAIVRTAVLRASAHYGQPEFDRVVSVGDGVWDIHTACRLGLAFVGVGRGQKAERLYEAGASYVIENFLRDDYCFECLNQADRPFHETRLNANNKTSS